MLCFRICHSRCLLQLLRLRDREMIARLREELKLSMQSVRREVSLKARAACRFATCVLKVLFRAVPSKFVGESCFVIQGKIAVGSSELLLLLLLLRTAAATTTANRRTTVLLRLLWLLLPPQNAWQPHPRPQRPQSHAARA